MENSSKIQDIKNLLLRREKKGNSSETIDKETTSDSQSGSKISENPRLFAERIGNVFKRKEKESPAPLVDETLSEIGEVRIQIKCVIRKWLSVPVAPGQSQFSSSPPKFNLTATLGSPRGEQNGISAKQTHLNSFLTRSTPENFNPSDSKSTSASFITNHVIPKIESKSIVRKKILVQVVEARIRKSPENINPYVIIKYSKKAKKTKVKLGNSPVFSQTFKFKVKEDCSDLEVTLWDQLNLTFNNSNSLVTGNLLNSCTFVGYATIPIDSLETNKLYDYWYPLNIPSGEHIPTVPSELVTTRSSENNPFHLPILRNFIPSLQKQKSFIVTEGITPISDDSTSISESGEESETSLASNSSSVSSISSPFLPSSPTSTSPPLPSLDTLFPLDDNINNENTDPIYILRKNTKARFNLFGIQIIILLNLYIIGYFRIIGGGGIFILSVLILIFLFNYSNSLFFIEKKSSLQYSVPRIFKKVSNFLNFNFSCCIIYVTGSIHLVSPFTAVIIAISLLTTLFICLIILYSTPIQLSNISNPFPFPINGAIATSPESCKWLNAWIAKQWPFISKRFAEAVEEQLAFVLEDYLTQIANKIHMSVQEICGIQVASVQLSDSPIQVKSIYGTNSDSSHYEVNLDTEYEGTLSIKIEIAGTIIGQPVRLWKLKIEVCNFEGGISVSLESDENPPFIKSAIMKFRSQPNLKIRDLNPVLFELRNSIEKGTKQFLKDFEFTVYSKESEAESQKVSTTSTKPDSKKVKAIDRKLFGDRRLLNNASVIGVEVMHKFVLKKEPIPFVLNCNYCHKLGAVRKAWICSNCAYLCHFDCRQNVSSVGECGAKDATLSDNINRVFVREIAAKCIRVTMTRKFTQNKEMKDCKIFLFDDCLLVTTIKSSRYEIFSMVKWRSSSTGRNIKLLYSPKEQVLLVIPPRQQVIYLLFLPRNEDDLAIIEKTIESWKSSNLESANSKTPVFIHDIHSICFQVSSMYMYSLSDRTAYIYWIEVSESSEESQSLKSFNLLKEYSDFKILCGQTGLDSELVLPKPISNLDNQKAVQLHCEALTHLLNQIPRNLIFENNSIDFFNELRNQVEVTDYNNILNKNNYNFLSDEI